MKRSMYVAGLAGFLSLGSAGLAAAPAVPPPPGAASVINSVGLKLLSGVDRESSNQVLSPYSILSALAMVYGGADGETHREMTRLFGWEGEELALHQSFAALDTSLNDVAKQSAARTEQLKQSGIQVEPLSLNIVNRLFGEQHYTFRESFLTLVREQYGAPLQLLDFQRNPVGALGTINRWVSVQTKERIRDLIPPEGITDQTRLVLVNALYFKAPWAEAFPSHATAPKPFWSAGTQAVEVSTLHRQDRFGYQRREGYSLVTIPYADPALQFLIVLPDAKDGLKSVETQLTAEALARAANVPRVSLDLYLPKFKLEPGVLRLGAALRSLGLRTAFDIPPGSANFDRMAERKPQDYLTISEVFHQAFVTVDEKGSEAAAATAVTMMRATSVMPNPAKPIEVRVDHPFLFAIQHRASGACLFLGRVIDPR